MREEIRNGTIVPAHYQPGLSRERFLRDEVPGEDAVPLDVLIVGAGPAGLAAAIELAKLSLRNAEQGGELGRLEIGVLEKAGELGEHSLSGAVVNPGPFRELFPELSEEEFPFRGRVERDRVYLLTEKGKLRLPLPPSMRNRGNYVASICEIVRWLGEQAEALGVNLFTGFPAEALLLGGRGVVGVRTTPAGLDRNGEPGVGYMPPTDLSARVTVLAEGTRGSLTQAWLERERIGSPNPQIWALGVKELWRVCRPLKAIVHTLGWPLPRDAFGGSWIYPMAEDLVSLGLVVGLDYRHRTLDVHLLLQQMKEHPYVSGLIEGGELVEWGAKTIPEGGFWSLPDRLHGHRVLVVGDAAGFVNVASLKGIHYAVLSGILAARTIFEALRADDVTATGLSAYDRRVRESVIARDLHRTRNMRLAFRSGFWSGGLKAALMQLTGGALLGGRVPREPDAEVPRRPGPAPQVALDGTRSFRKPDAVYRSGNATRDDIPSHLVVPEELPAAVADFYSHICPAGVYERVDERLVVNASNCIDCKVTDILGPRWTPREGGSGPAYKRM